jgi:predicted Holliday junction resolvase-like endonuclease
MQNIAVRKTSSTIIDVMRATDQIAGYCPSCHELFRMSEVELFYIPDRKKDFLTELRKKQLELDEQIGTEREDAIKRSRSSLMGKLFETVRPFLPEFSHHPGDLRSIWNPIDFVSFNGLALNRCVESITFVEVKSGRSSLTGVERSVREAVEQGKVSFETVTHPSLDGLREVAEIPILKTQNKKH